MNSFIFVFHFFYFYFFDIYIYLYICIFIYLYMCYILHGSFTLQCSLYFTVLFILDNTDYDLQYIFLFFKYSHCLRSVRIRGYSDLYFPSFGLNTEKYIVSLRIQAEYGKIRTIITLNTDTFT